MLEEGVSKMSEKFSGGRCVRELVSTVAGPRLISDTRESWLRRAARNAGTPFRQAKALFYGEISDPHHRTIALFRDAAGRNEAKNLAVQFESLAQALNVRDSDFHSPDVAALLNAARALRGLDSAGTQGAHLNGSASPPSAGLEGPPRENAASALGQSIIPAIKG